MNKPQMYRRSDHCVYLCDYHIVLPTKYRHPVITPEIWKYLYGKLIEITDHYKTLYIKEANHDRDHIHLLISIPPQMSVGKAIGLLKTNTASRIKEKFPELKKWYWGMRQVFFGREDIFCSTVGITTETIRRYIANQGELDTGQTATLFD